MSVLNINIQQDSAQQDSAQQDTAQQDSVQQCYKCKKQEENAEIKKFCKCKNSFFHRKCFKEWILENKSVECKYCYQNYKNVDYTSKIRISSGYKYIVYTAISNTMLLSILWIFFFTSVNKECNINFPISFKQAQSKFNLDSNYELSKTLFVNQV